MPVYSGPAGDPFIANAATAGIQRDPEVTPLADGRYVVLWRSTTDSINYSIHGRLFEADGTPSGGEFEVFDVTSNLVPQLAVVPVSDGSFVVIETSFGLDGSVTGIEGLRMSANGTAIGASFTINTYNSSLQQYPEAEVLTNGTIAVVWDSFGQDQSGYAVAGRVIDANGNLIGTEFVANSFTTGNQQFPDVAALTSGGFVTVWASTGQQGGVNGIYGQRFSASGTPLGAEFLISAGSHEGTNQPTVVGLAGGGFAAIWREAENTPGQGFTNYVAARVFDNAGTALGPSFTVNTSTGYDTQTPDGTALPDGGFLSIWFSTGSVLTDHPPGFYGQRFAADGSPVGGEFLIRDNLSASVERMDVAALPNGDVLAVYNEITAAGTDRDVYVQLIANTGEVLGSNAGELLNGSFGPDLLRGFGGNDTILGRDGPDTLDGGTGDDFIFGGLTEDDLRDVVFAGAGNDSVEGGYGNDSLSGGDGNDTIEGGFGVDTVIGNGGDDVLTGSAWSDAIFGGAGADFINGGFGFDRVNGGADADRFFHLGVQGHGSDWIQDYDAAEGDVLQSGIAGSSAADYQVNIANTPNAGAAGVAEAFVIYIPTRQILWALVDGDAQAEINLQIGGGVFDLLA